MPSIELIGISKKYKGENVLGDFNLHVKDGETLVIFGPSGGGKTVLLRLICGVIEADTGRIVVDGNDITDVEPEYRNIGMAFQNFALFPHMTAFDNIASPLVAKNKSQEIIFESVQAIARLLKIDNVLNHYPRALSNGQKQRTAFARALVSSPPILLLDDPMRNVDAKLRFEMRLELPRLLSRQNATVIYVTQDYKEAMALADRIAVISDGRIQQLATPQDIYLKPAHVEIAQLFGDPPINLIEVIPHANDKGIVMDLAGQSIPLTVPEAEKAVGKPCLLGLRPEIMRFVDADHPYAMPVSIEAETPLNEKIVTLVTTNFGQEILISRPSQTTGPRDKHAHVSFDESQALLFDRQSQCLLTAVSSQHKITDKR